MGPRTKFLLAIALAAAVCSGVARAEEETVSSRPLAVVELFTSQGCNSCPPADEMLSSLADRGDVLALSYHVDYWDYLGWRDTLATPENTERQRAYSRAFGSRSVYTPQFVVNGRKNLSGAKTQMVEGALKKLDANGRGLSVDIVARYTADSIVIEAGAPSEPGTSKAHLVLAFFEPSKRVNIKSGKNGGRTTVYRNSVMAMQSVGMWHGEAARVELPLSELSKNNSGGCAILLQQMGPDGAPGPIIGATLLSMPSS